MPDTPPPATHEDEATPSPSTVGNSFMRQYYHFLAKEPQSLHRFYKTESRWCHGVGSHMEEPIAGQRAINEQILKRGYAGARVDLDAGSIDCQNSLAGGVLVLVTGVMTLRTSSEPKPFVQTFFLAVQLKGYFVLNDCLRFLELPGVSPIKEKEAKEKETPQSPVKNGSKETFVSPVKETVNASPKKLASPVKVAVKTTSTTITKGEKDVDLPAKTTTVPSSPVKKIITSTTTTKKEEVDLNTPSPVSSPVKSPVKSPKKQETTFPATPVPAPADPVVPTPTEPEKPKTWAALFSPASKATAVISLAAAPVSAPIKPSTPKAVAPTSAPVAPVSSPTQEKSPKNKSVSGKEKEPKRFYSLFIRDVPSQTRDSDLRELFKGYGSIAGVSVVAQRGFAFVDYFEQESMRAALAETTEFKLYEKVLVVDERAERKDGQRGTIRSNDSRGRGRGPKGGRGERKERPGDDAPTSNKTERPRREKTGNRRGGKTDNRAE